MDQISQHFCTQDKARQSVWTRIQSYGISLRTFERSSRVHYLSTITIYVLVSLPHFLPLFALLIDWKAQKFLKVCSVRMWRHCMNSDMGSVARAPPTLQNFTNVESCSWCKNVSGHWNAEKWQYKCNNYDSTKSLFLYILHFLVNKKNDVAIQI